MPDMKTPGVYITETSILPNSIVEVATAVPAFIGYTSMAQTRGKSLINKPWRITSMAEYEEFYGGAPLPKFRIEDTDNPGAADLKIPATTVADRDKGKILSQENQKFILYYSIKLFFQNGGGPCYIVSVGDYDAQHKGDGKGEIKATELMAGIATLINEQEPTMLVIPEAMSLAKPEECTTVQQAALLHCGGKMRNRVAILDVYDGFKDRHDPDGDCVANFRNNLGTSYLDYASAYYPWVHTTIVQEADIGFSHLSTSGKAALIEILNDELKVDVVDDIPKKRDGTTPTRKGQALLDRRKAYGEKIAKIIDLDADFAATKNMPGLAGKSDDEIASAVLAKRVLLNKSLLAISPLYRQLIKSIGLKLNLLPPAAAMAGVYTAVDNSRGVWKAPANVSLASVSSPSVNITHEDQEDLNVTPQGKSINAIRHFTGMGTLVWGARTLDGNSQEWRYINIRRTMIMLEESIRMATKACVFEANNAQTWTTIKSMISNFLTDIWRRGGLAGVKPDEAFSVNVGLGETMTPDDILDGILRVTVMVAMIRPAEFMVITISQKMQES